MAIATGLAIAGALSGAYGAKKQADAQKRASQSAANAAKFTPYNVAGPGGRAYFEGQNAQANFSPDQAAMYGLLGQNAQQMLGGQGPQAQLYQQLMGIGGGQLPGLFDQGQQAAGMLPTGAYEQYQQQLSGLQGGLGNLFGQVQGLANQDVSGLINDRLGLLNAQAAPGEEQQRLGMEQRLFNQGRLSNTGGIAQMGDLLRVQGQNQLGRQMAAQDLGLQAQNQNFNMANLLGSQGQGLFGMAGNMAGNQFGSALNMSDLTNARAQQRIQSAMGLFGFGNVGQQQDWTQGFQAMQGQQSMEDQLRQMIALGGNLGGAQAEAGANQGRALLTNNTSPFGAMLGGFGTGLLNQSLSATPQQPRGFDTSTGIPWKP